MYFIFLILGLASFLLYFPMESRKVKGHSLEIGLDRRIPMISEFVIPYILFFPYVLGVFLWAFFIRASYFPQLALSLILVSVVTTVIYLGFPSRMVRPFGVGNLRVDGFTDRLVRLIQKFDKPNNVFPSNHVAYSLVVTFFLVATFPAYVGIFWIIFAFIAASTVMIKQHYLVDVPAGAVLAIVIWYAVGYFL